MAEWISVKDRLPDESMIRKQIVVFVQKHNISPYIEIMRWWGEVPYGVWLNVTHWMPLPELPNDD